MQNKIYTTAHIKMSHTEVMYLNKRDFVKLFVPIRVLQARRKNMGRTIFIVWVGSDGKLDMFIKTPFPEISP